MGILQDIFCRVIFFTGYFLLVKFTRAVQDYSGVGIINILTGEKRK